MAAPIRKKTSRVQDTWKQKRWYKVLSPASFGSREIGEAVAIEESTLVGRTAKVSLMKVTGDPKKQNTSATFKIVKVVNGQALTQLKQLNKRD